MPFPDLSPIALQIGPLAIRWYALAYVAGIFLGWWYFTFIHHRRPVPGMDKKAVEDTLTYVVFGVILGGRLGYVLFYKPLYYLENPLEIGKLWEGGMSFHGGMIGVILALWLLARRRGFSFWRLIDYAACVAPIGLFFGRLANFVNGELFGRVADVPWAIIFPHGGPMARHPSQLYEAGMEGILLFTLLNTVLWLTRARERPSTLSGLFLLGYASARIVAECFREPDAHLGFLYAHLTMGQLLCIPMMLLGLFLIFRPRHEPSKTA